MSRSITPLSMEIETPRAGGVDGIRGHWEDVAEVWRRTRPEQLWRRHTDLVNVEWFVPRLPDSGVARILKTDLFDEATSGGLVPALRAKARVVVGIDLSRTTTREAVDRVDGLRAACADARRLPFPDASIDRVVSNSTLDHFENERDFLVSLGELRRVLRPDGELLLSLDNRMNPVIALRNALPFDWLRRLRIMPFYVGWTCGPRGLARRLEANGWTVQEMGAILHCPRFLSIHLSRLVERSAGAAAHERWLSFLHTFERLAGWPTRYLTGSFVTVRATRTMGD